MKILQTYYKEKFFISTILRQSSCIEAFPSEYYETMVFKWDKETKRTLGIIEQYESNTECQAIETHCLAIRELSEKEYEGEKG